jgi:hypothetical protein
MLADGKTPSSFSVGATARCGLWPVEQYLSIFPYLSPTLSIFSLPALEDLFPLLSIFPGSSSSSRPFQFLSEDLYGHPIFLHFLQVTEKDISKLTGFFFAFLLNTLRTVVLSGADTAARSTAGPTAPTVSYLILMQNSQLQKCRQKWHKFI